ncbi:MAG TPA: DUF1810 domain-containing protein [Candidatus Mediterraneibacter excrementigallinarum]|nr:DUF1810 domain-containing protein [Candidatus Mediterraneibacter excrementigallinarum]
MTDLKRFHEAQSYAYKTALAEIQGGRKESHWMWYIFPQIAGLGKSSTAQYYAIQNLQEARDYLKDEVLGSRLEEISKTLLHLKTDDALQVMGWLDNMKLRSSMTLFAVADPRRAVFEKVLEKYFHGEKDPATLKILEGQMGEKKEG